MLRFKILVMKIYCTNILLYVCTVHVKFVRNSTRVRIRDKYSKKHFFIYSHRTWQIQQYININPNERLESMDVR